MAKQSATKAPGWRVAVAEFETSASDPRQCPPANRPEVAFAGRSNVGKSSLINALTGRRSLARVSRAPGRTRLLNFFSARILGPKTDLPVRFVDLPGFGFAAAHRSIRDTWGPMIEGYLQERPVLAGLVLLVDVRRDVGELDLALAALATAHGRPTLVVGTKADKLGASGRGLVRRRIAEAFGASAQDILLTSATTTMGIGGGDGLVAELASLADAIEIPGGGASESGASGAGPQGETADVADVEAAEDEQTSEP